MNNTEHAKLKTNATVDAEVFKITNFGAFVKLENGQRGLIHISQIADNFVKNITDHIKLGDKVKARVLNIAGGKIDLTLKKPKEDVNSSYPRGKEFRTTVFEDKLKNFMVQSEEKLVELERHTEAKQH